MTQPALALETFERGLHREITALGRWLSARPGFAGLLLLFIVVYGLVANAWVGEDAYITLRSVEQVLAGNGPRWNPHERVQAYTHAPWFWMLCAARLVVPSSYYAAIALGLLCSFAAVALFYVEVKRRRGVTLAVLAVIAFLSSKAVMDYTTSGLENSLSYLLVVVLLASTIRFTEEAGTHGSGTFALAVVAAALLAANRPDTAPLSLPLLVLLAREHARRRGLVRTGILVLAGALPLLASLVFSTVYYGLPLPNTVYAKLNDGVGPLVSLARGARYFLFSSVFDPLLAAIVIAGAAVTLRAPSLHWRVIGLAIVFDVLAVTAIGGDFMAGRFLAPAVVAALFALMLRVGDRGASRLAFCLLLFAFYPFHPLHPFADRYGGHAILGVADERAFYAPSASLEAYTVDALAGSERPDHPWFHWGREFARSPRAAMAVRNIGFFGYAAGLDKIVIDEHALSDPFLARLPPTRRWRERAGHGVRDLPEGYLDTVATGRNNLRDPALAAYYEKVRVLTQSTPLWSRERLETIVRFNLGQYDALRARYEARAAAGDPPGRPSERRPGPPPRSASTRPEERDDP